MLYCENNKVNGLISLPIAYILKNSCVFVSSNKYERLEIRQRWADGSVYKPSNRFSITNRKTKME